MLNDNLSKIRKERGLTQEALAIKLNVVRQTISKWEQGTAVPDADTLIKIAEAFEVSVTELLGAPSATEIQSYEAVTKALAEINEQLAARNRLSHRIWKIIGFTLLWTVILIAVLTAFSFARLRFLKTSLISTNVAETDQNGLPLFANLKEMDESDIAETLLAVKKEYLHMTWGEPTLTEADADLWKIGDELFFRVFYDDNGYVIACGKEGQ